MRKEWREAAVIFAVVLVGSMLAAFMLELGPGRNLAGQVPFPGTFPVNYAPPTDPNDGTEYLTVDASITEAGDTLLHIETSDDRFIHRRAYYLSESGTWRGFNFTEETVQGSGWISSGSVREISSADQGFQDMPLEGYAIIYACKEYDPAVGFICGPRITTQTPSQKYWTLAFYNASAPSTSTTATLTATPNPVTSGSVVTLTWSSTGATSCAVTQGGASGFTITGGATSGSDASTAITTSTTFAISCTGSEGTATASVTVQVSAPQTQDIKVIPTIVGTRIDPGTQHIPPDDVLIELHLCKTLNQPLTQPVNYAITSSFNSVTGTLTAAQAEHQINLCDLGNGYPERPMHLERIYTSEIVGTNLALPITWSITTHASQNSDTTNDAYTGTVRVCPTGLDFCVDYGPPTTPYPGMYPRCHDSGSATSTGILTCQDYCESVQPCSAGQICDPETVQCTGGTSTCTNACTPGQVSCGSATGGTGSTHLRTCTLQANGCWNWTASSCPTGYCASNQCGGASGCDQCQVGVGTCSCSIGPCVPVAYNIANTCTIVNGCATRQSQTCPGAAPSCNNGVCTGGTTYTCTTPKFCKSTQPANSAPATGTCPGGVSCFICNQGYTYQNGQCVSQTTATRYMGGTDGTNWYQRTQSGVQSGVACDTMNTHKCTGPDSSIIGCFDPGEMSTKWVCAYGIGQSMPAIYQCTSAKVNQDLRTNTAGTSKACCRNDGGSYVFVAGPCTVPTSPENLQTMGIDGKNSCWDSVDNDGDGKSDFTGAGTGTPEGTDCTFPFSGISTSGLPQGNIVTPGQQYVAFCSSGYGWQPYLGPIVASGGGSHGTPSYDGISYRNTITAPQSGTQVIKCGSTRAGASVNPAPELTVTVQAGG